jgi:hypothetical protein
VTVRSSTYHFICISLSLAERKTKYWRERVTNDSGPDVIVGAECDEGGWAVG